MLKDIVAVEPLEAYRLCVHFEDGVVGVVDVAELVSFTGIFTPLKDRSYFLQVRVNPEIGTICWPNEADLDPDVLYAQISGKPIPEFPIVTVASS
jgi:hypothetical protein